MDDKPQSDLWISPRKTIIIETVDTFSLHIKDSTSKHFFKIKLVETNLFILYIQFQTNDRFVLKEIPNPWKLWNENRITNMIQIMYRMRLEHMFQVILSGSVVILFFIQKTKVFLLMKCKLNFLQLMDMVVSTKTVYFRSLNASQMKKCLNNFLVLHADLSNYNLTITALLTKPNKNSWFIRTRFDWL